MNHSTFKSLLIVAGLVCTVQSSYKDPSEPILPHTPEAKPEQYGNHVEQKCGVILGGGGWNYEGTCEFPISADQCEDGLSVRTKSWSKKPCPIDWHSQSDNEEEKHEGEPRRYLCCIRQACGPNLVGRCQNIYKNCPGTWLIAALDGTPVENHCPIQDETFVGCCGPRELSSKAEDSTTKSNSLMPGLCSITNEKACGLKDESQIPTSLQSQQSLGASLDAGLQNGYTMYKIPPLGNQADEEPQMQIKDQSYLDRNKYSMQAVPGDSPVIIAHMTTESLQHDGWDSLPSLANSAPIGRGPYIQGSPYAQALAAAAPDSNTETNNDFTDWRVTT